MPKAKAPTNPAESDDQAAPLLVQPDGANAIGVNPILYEPIALPPRPLLKGVSMAAAEAATSVPADEPPRVIEAEGQTGYVAVLSHRLPEPTSYTGKNIIALQFEDGTLSENASRSRLLKFDGSSTYVDCGNPPQLQGREGNSLTIEAWVKIENPEGRHEIVAHGHGHNPDDTRGGSLLNDFYLRIWDANFQFGAWNGERATGVLGAKLTVGGPPRPVRPFVEPELLDPHFYAGARNPDEAKRLRDRAYAEYLKNTPMENEPQEVSLAVTNQDVGVWIHLAGVYDHTSKSYTLYRNGKLLASVTGDFAPPRIDSNWLIGAADDRVAGGMGRFFKGRIAEVRIWTVARTAAQIVDNMWESAMSAPPGHLGAYWRLADGSGSEALDSSGRDCHGTVKGATSWEWDTSPIAESERLRQRQNDASAKAALEAAKRSGFFDPSVFPRVRRVMTQNERQEAAAALLGRITYSSTRDKTKDRLTEETFLDFYQRGYHLILRRAFSGVMEYEFLPNPPAEVRPQLMLVEEYRLSSFLGSYGVGRVVKSFSLLPGEKTKLTIRLASRTETTRKQSQSILDSYSEESAREFEDSLADENSRTDTSSQDFSWHASVQAGGSWGFARCKVEAGAEGSTNSAREEFGKTVHGTTQKHASRASNNRNVQVDTMSETKAALEETSEIVRDIENINVGRTLNFVFCQMNQEFISLLHLVDVRIGYTNGIDEVREVPLYELPEFLERVVVPEKREAVEQRIIRELESIHDYQGNEPSGKFIVGVEDSKAPVRHAVNRDFASTYSAPTARPGAPVARYSVPGVIISAKTIVMRTDDVVVDALIGQGWALDPYSRALQEEEKRRKRLANNAAKLSNDLMAFEHQRNALLLKLAKEKDLEALKVCADLLRPTLPGNPQRVVGIWEQGAASRDGSAAPSPSPQKE